ncbi:unnamed protein product [Rotaria magnacalcarata]|uniref:Uncharacterized protein n=5 Tax=Rotaria magnacalcarata TaxID=392030 RepID=A0A817ADD3_9BILA|nr:unnamed protein product [Rotaria magnacalcarata]CAF2044094.1 unnamed protein product [Rotaria magnacalcarata]CAF2251425.1 unnamed protein product [Rotaria magnacalcarata]CAF4023385.1 unnamed protein product [Rotaria magnacalcarata]CAF4056129.1 unnamed protein product [Rotaria magnacalcarata]
MTQRRSRKPIVSDMSHFTNLNGDDDDNDDDDDDDEKHWYHIRSPSPPSSLSINNNFTHQLSPSTMGSWGFDVNRPTNGQTLLSFTSNNNSNNDQHTIPRRTKDYNERLVDISSSLSSQNFPLRTPTLTRHRNGNEFAAVDRLVLGPNRMKEQNYYLTDDLYPQEVIPTNQSPVSSNNHRKTQAEQELIAWQNRMLQRDHRNGCQSPNVINRKNGLNSSQSSSRQIASSTRPISAMSNMSGSQYLEHDFHESTIKSARVIKRYIELLYHLQTYYERITNQLFNGNKFLRTNESSQSIFINHCRKISDQLQKLKPIWEEKLAYLQNLLKNISSFEWSTIKSETTFLQRRSNLNNLIQTLNTQKDLDETDLSIRADIDRVLHDDKLAVQLQEELSTLLQHQSLLNDLTALLQWNRQIYSRNEQNRVENVLPLLREQTATTDSYISHVSQQLTELVINLRSLEKYILSYTNTIPSIDDRIVPSKNGSSNRNHWRPYEENDLDELKIKESRLQEYDRNGNRNGDLPIKKTRSASLSRVLDSEESNHYLDREDQRTPPKKSNIHVNGNSNNNNNTGTIARLATVKSAKRDNKSQPNSILKPYPPTPSLNERKINFDINTEILKPNRVDIPDHRFVDFDSDDQVLAMHERIGKLKRRDESRKVVSKQNLQIMNEQDFDDDHIRSYLNQRKFDKEQERALNIQSRLAEETKEKTREIAAKHALYKAYPQRAISPHS